MAKMIELAKASEEELWEVECFLNAIHYDVCERIKLHRSLLKDGTLGHKTRAMVKANCEYYEKKYKLIYGESYDEYVAEHERIIEGTGYEEG